MFKWVESVDVGQFYGEISVIFFLSFRLKTAALSVWCVRFHVERENMFLFESRLFLDEEFLLLFFLVVVSLSFFFAERKQAEQLFKFLSLCLSCFFSFVRFTRERLAF